MFKVGQTVWCLLYGKGVVISVKNEPEVAFPVAVEFDKELRKCESYTSDGRYYTDSDRVLFFSKPKIEAETKPPFEPALLDKNVVLFYKNFGKQYFGIVDQETENSITIKSLNGDTLHFAKNHVDIYLAELTKVPQ